MIDRLIDWIIASKARATITATLVMSVVVVAAHDQSWWTLPFGIAVVFLGSRACWSAGFIGGVDAASALAADVIDAAVQEHIEIIDGLTHLLKKERHQ